MKSLCVSLKNAVRGVIWEALAMSLASASGPHHCVSGSDEAEARRDAENLPENAPWNKERPVKWYQCVSGMAAMLLAFGATAQADVIVHGGTTINMDFVAV